MTERELEHTLALYAGTVTFVDRWVGVLLDRIRELGIYENSLIMFTSDHGEPFGEHGVVRKARPGGHEELAHIPWIVRHPEGQGRGKRFAGFVQTPDLMPTVLESLGIEIALGVPYASPGARAMPQDIVTRGEKQPFTGRSLLPILRGETDSIRDFAVTAHHKVHWTIRTEEWTYILYFNGMPPELYNRNCDPTEQHNIWETDRNVADELEIRLRRFAAQTQ
jgi:arylsulfatase A-like enzyme